MIHYFKVVKPSTPLSEFQNFHISKVKIWNRMSLEKVMEEKNGHKFDFSAADEGGNVKVVNYE